MKIELRVAALLAIHAAVAAQAQSGEWISIGKKTFFGYRDIYGKQIPAQEVDIKFPSKAPVTFSSDVPAIEWGGWKIQLNEFGNLGRAFRGAGGWDEFRTLYETAQQRIASGKTNVWKVRAAIFRRTEVEYLRADGVMEIQAGYINNPEVLFCLETFARYEALVEAFTQGAVDVQIDATLEEEPIYGRYSATDTWTYDPWTAGHEFFTNRFNRGDYDAILYFFHPGATRSYSFGGTGGRTNNATQSYVILSNGREGGLRIGHTEAMLHEWFHQIEDTYRIWGYGDWEYAWPPNLHAAEVNGYSVDEVGYTGWFSWLRDLMFHSVRPGMWERLSNRVSPDWEQAFLQTHRGDGRLFDWKDVSDDPWAKLPYLRPEDIAARIGAESVAFQGDGPLLLVKPTGGKYRTPILTAPSATDHSLNNHLNFRTEAMARIGYGDRDLLFVRFDVADFVLSNLVPGTPCVLGYIEVDGRFMVVADARLNNDAACEVNLLSFSNGPARISTSGTDEPLVGQSPAVSFRSDTSDVRYVVTSWEGDAVRINAAGQIGETSNEAATRLLRVTAVQQDGTRSERPFVVRWRREVVSTLRAQDTARVSSSTHRLELVLESPAAAKAVELSASAPTGFSIQGLPPQVSLSAGEKRVIPFTLEASADATFGQFEIALDIRVAGSAAPVDTQRLSLFRQGPGLLTEETFESGVGTWGEPRADRNGWEVSTVSGGVNGNCLRILDTGGSLWGRVNFFGKRSESGALAPDNMGYDAADYPILDFYLKTTAHHNVGLAVTLSNGKRYVVMLAGPYHEQWGESVELPRASFIPDGQWHRVVYDLGAALAAAAGPGPHVVVDIGFGDTRQFSSNQWHGDFRSEHFVDEVRIASSPNASSFAPQVETDPDTEIKGGANPTSTDLRERARAAANLKAESSPEEITAVRALLADTSPLVRLNAVRAFTRVKLPEVVPDLVRRMVADAEPRIGMWAARALAYQDTEEAWAALAEMPRTRRYGDLPAAEAALQLGTRKDPKYLKDLIVMFACSSALGRRAGAQGIGQIPGEAAQGALMTFIHDVDPFNRWEVTRLADVAFDPAARQVEFGSVNDESNRVRAVSYAKLTRSADPVLRSRGYIGLKEDDPDIRRIILEELASQPSPQHAPQVSPLLTDPDPDVRAAAVQALLTIDPAAVAAAAQAWERENYRQVLIPLLSAGKAGKLRLPAGFLDRLASHRDAEVRKLVSEIRR
ncbi:HEAT repeat domain-containing protein [Fimbriimonadia bacterium ATM]|nr:MAG: HEAT repeat domain-containing protein [Armatimonadota bacterium]MBC6968606.1 HEAT repeat domain-containing protein [Armatimonadota bacterium]MCE7898555.1 HEAT repeat domain-containing protein [Armatimonadetes bacterium ATM1]MDL1928152.1 HEAT repeat domain-containing protein [Fimbriimonadia bacterium ATM]RIJ98283.1 MAG: hypothetical protein DCC45_00495 [Armatimonadota bacterium]